METMNTDSLAVQAHEDAFSRSVSTNTDEEVEPVVEEPKFKDAYIQQPSVRTIAEGVNQDHI
jgi:hypothetical protein